MCSPTGGAGDRSGGEVEPSDEAFIRYMIAQGYATDADTQHHKGVLVWRDGAAIFDPDEPASPSRRAAPVLLQLVPEPKTVKNRMHLDVRVGKDNIEKVLEQVQARGGTFLHRASQGPQLVGDRRRPGGQRVLHHLDSSGGACAATRAECLGRTARSMTALPGCPQTASANRRRHRRSVDRAAARRVRVGCARRHSGWFEAYARVLHPAESSDAEPARWSEVAAACGKVAHR